MGKDSVAWIGFIVGTLNRTRKALSQRFSDEGCLCWETFYIFAYCGFSWGKSNHLAAIVFCFFCSPSNFNQILGLGTGPAGWGLLWGVGPAEEPAPRRLRGGGERHGEGSLRGVMQ